jgi:hypothetical protein
MNNTFWGFVWRVLIILLPPNHNLEGIINLLDEITDQAHDKYGIDCLLSCEEN